MRGMLSKAMQRRGVVIAVWAVALTLLAGASYATVAGNTPTPKPHASGEADDNGVHGGPQPRIHSGCNLAHGLTGNWTHGDYVSAVAKASPGDSAKVKEAAHSDCGKVDHSKQKHGKSDEDHGKPATPKPESSGS
jgi:hypothetical protein